MVDMGDDRDVADVHTSKNLTAPSAGAGFSSWCEPFRRPSGAARLGGQL
jgi:hypothetical protein